LTPYLNQKIQKNQRTRPLVYSLKQVVVPPFSLYYIFQTKYDYEKLSIYNVYYKTITNFVNIIPEF
jgi:hypothetical protein